MINLELGFAFEADGLAGAQESLDLLQAQFLCFVHADGQSSACHPLQAHLVLESHLPFRLILYWIRLGLQSEQSLEYNGVRLDDLSPADAMPSNRPNLTLDEQSFQGLLSAAFTIQEHNDRRKLARQTQAEPEAHTEPEANRVCQH